MYCGFSHFFDLNFKVVRLIFQPRTPPTLVLSLSPGLGPDGLPSPGGYVSHAVSSSAATVTSTMDDLSSPMSRDSPPMTRRSPTNLQNVNSRDGFSAAGSNPIAGN